MNKIKALLSKVKSNHILALLLLVPGFLMVEYPNKFDLFTITIVVGALVMLEGLNLMFDKTKYE